MPETTATTPDGELDRVGLEYRAQANAADAPVQKAVDKLEQAQAPAVDLSTMTHQELAELLMLFVALGLPKLDKRLVYTDAEQAAIAKPLALVIKKYFPDDAVPPELALIGTAAIITWPKLKAPPKAETPARGGPADPKPSEAPPAP